MRPLSQKLTVLAMALATGCLGTALLAQRHPGGMGRQTPPRPAPGARPGRPGGPKARPDNPAMAVDRWNAMSSEERDKALAKLPPERQKQILARIERFNNLPKEEQERLRQRAEKLGRLPPDKRQQVLRQIERFSQVPKERRQVLSQELETLRSMPDGERSSRMASEEFRTRYAPDEQEMIRDLSQILASR